MGHWGVGEITQARPKMSQQAQKMLTSALYSHRKLL